MCQLRRAITAVLTGALFTLGACAPDVSPSEPEVHQTSTSEGERSQSPPVVHVQAEEEAPVSGANASPRHLSVEDALLSNDVEQAQELLNAGEPLPEMASSGLPLIVELARQGHRESLHLLHVSGADVGKSWRTLGGDTVLHQLAQAGPSGMIPFMVGELGVAVDAVNRQRETALHAAVRSNRPEAVRALLDAGANAAAKNQEEKSPLQLAIAADAAEIAALLTQPPAPTKAP